MHPYLYAFLCVLGTVGLCITTYQLLVMAWSQTDQGVIFRRQFKSVAANMTWLWAYIFSFNVLLRVFSILYLMSHELYYLAAIITIDYLGPYIAVPSYYLVRKFNRKLAP